MGNSEPPIRAGILELPIGLREVFQSFTDAAQMLDWRRTFLASPCRITPAVMNALQQPVGSQDRHAWCVYVEQDNAIKTVLFYTEYDCPSPKGPGFVRWLQDFNPQNQDDLLMASRLYELEHVRGRNIKRPTTVHKHWLVDAILYPTRGYLLWGTQLHQVLKSCLSPYPASLLSLGWTLEGLIEAIIHKERQADCQNLLRKFTLANGQSLATLLRERMILPNIDAEPNHAAAALLWDWRIKKLEDPPQPEADFEHSPAMQEWLSIADPVKDAVLIDYECNLYPSCAAIHEPEWFAAKLAQDLIPLQPENPTPEQFKAYLDALDARVEEILRQIEDNLS